MRAFEGSERPSGPLKTRRSHVSASPNASKVALLVFFSFVMFVYVLALIEIGMSDSLSVCLSVHQTCF